MQDISAKTVEILVRQDKKVLWVNTEEGCVLRISNIESIITMGDV